MDELLLGLGTLVGLLVGVFIGRARAARELQRLRDERAESVAELKAYRAAHDEQRRTEEQSRKDIENAFAQLSQNALKANTEQFLKLTSQNFQPVKESLAAHQKFAQELEVKREGAYRNVEKQLELLRERTEMLNASSQTLATALRGDARARGRWGEVTLRKIVELAGMTNHVDFTTQETVGDGGRPDMIVRMPESDMWIPVDSKVPMDAYMRAMEAEDAGVRARESQEHAKAMLQHVKDLSKRNYAEAVGGKVTYTVMFIPGEPILAAAFEANPGLQDEALDKHILLATPVTLIALLYTVAVYWKQSTIADDAQRVWNDSREFYKRVQTFASHFEGVGKGLDSALRGFNKAVGSYERMVLPQGRKLDELGVPGSNQDSLPELKAMEQMPRELSNTAFEGAVDDEDSAEEASEAGPS